MKGRDRVKKKTIPHGRGVLRSEGLSEVCKVRKNHMVLNDTLLATHLFPIICFGILQVYKMRCIQIMNI